MGGGCQRKKFRNVFSDNTRVRIFIFLLRATQNVFPEFNIRLCDNNSESDFFFFPPPKSEYFSQQHWESEYFSALQVKWSFPKGKFKKCDHIYLAIDSHSALIFCLRCISIAQKKSYIYVKNFNTWQLCGFFFTFL
jgi:hypothetical protein